MPVQPRVPVEAELEDRQAGLRRDRDAHRVGDLEAVRAGELLLREEQQHQLLQLLILTAGKRSAHVARCQSASSMRCLCSTRLRRQSVSQPMRDRKIPHGHRRPAASANERRRASTPSPKGSPAPERALIARALEFAEPLYAGQTLSTGEPTWAHALGLAPTSPRSASTRRAARPGILFAAPKQLEASPTSSATSSATRSPALAAGVEKLYQLRIATRANPTEQNEVLRKMVLGMVEDVRVVLIRLAEPHADAALVREEAVRPSAPTTRARRSTSTRRSPTGSASGSSSGSSRTCRSASSSPSSTSASRSMLDEKRVEREATSSAIDRGSGRELEAAGVEAEITGRPKHIYSIWNKMRSKGARLRRALRRARAARDRARRCKDCYTALGVVHNLWPPIPKRVRRLHLAAQGQPATSRCTRR